MDPLWQRLTDFAAAHHGVITADEAHDLDIPSYRLAQWARTGRLVHAAPGAYEVAGLPPTWHQRVRVATGSGAAWASHRTAAALWALDGFDRRIVEVVTERGPRRPRRSWTVHESRTLRAVDGAIVDGLPATTIARTILDLPAVAHRYLVGKALDHGWRADGSLLDSVLARHRELPMRGRRGARLISEMLGERFGTKFTDSDFETATMRLLRSVGLPDPVPQHQVRDGDFVAYLDLAWPEIMWLVECDSLAHHSGKAPHEWDRRRRRRLKRLGWDGVEVTYDDVTKRAGHTAAELRELYEIRKATVAARGGSPSPPILASLASATAVSDARTGISTLHSPTPSEPA